MFLPAALALQHQEPHKHRHQPTTPLPSHMATVSPWQPRRKVSLQRQRKVQAVRLGGKNKPRRRGMVARMVRTLKRMRLKWLKLHYLRTLKRLKEHYRKMLKELAETGAAIETMLFMESTSIIPGGLTISSCPTRYGSDHPRSISV